jgi:glycosyltransferase involved in cell wall biosynthesis
MNTVLMIAFHYPPYKGGSGIQRTLKFSRYLPDLGWLPIVLTAAPRAYPNIDEEQLSDVPENISVVRAFALDAAKHLSVKGAYPSYLALPDRWNTWWLGAIASGLWFIYKHRPAVLWSTYPIATAHLIGLTLHKLTGVPWIADFRDSMTEENYPRNSTVRRSYQWIERQAAKHSQFVFTTASTMNMYLQRYSELSLNRCTVIPNGYDDEDFAGIDNAPCHQIGDSPVRLIHAGVIYTDDRDPTAFFRALARLKRDGLINSHELLIDLRASGSEEYYQALIDELKISDLVRLLPSLPYRKALQDCAAADALLLIQASSCNHQIPAKVYEYLRLRKPILALTPISGDTGRLLAETGGSTVVNLADEEGIYRSLPGFLNAVRSNLHPLPNPELIRLFSRKHQADELAHLFSRVIGSKAQ